MIHDPLFLLFYSFIKQESAKVFQHEFLQKNVLIEIKQPAQTKSMRVANYTAKL